jgi:hypothetical protein
MRIASGEKGFSKEIFIWPQTYPGLLAQENTLLAGLYAPWAAVVFSGNQPPENT